MQTWLGKLVAMREMQPKGGTMSDELVTLEQYKALTPFGQGYVVYMQEALPDSELKGLNNPYEVLSDDFAKWNHGNFKAMLDVQDGEE